MKTKAKLMHIDRTHQVPMPGKLAVSAHPISSLGLVSMPTYRTLARCSSFRAGEAHDVSSLAFVREIVNVPAILPQGQTLIVVSATLLVTNAMRIADEEGPNLVLNTEVDDVASRFVSQVANASLGSSALFVLGALQFFPTTRRLLASGLLLGKLAQLLRSLAFERTDATSGDDHGLACVRRDGCQVDLAQIDGGLDGAWSLLGLWDLHTDMQFKPMVPD
ncbi:hypothetical protein Krac_4199 [Ktedonobacter racemifer DSM 44963]|uniref:Uncharacterized protein n=1 Tax=Ktedonobacter racemifer DSM 44963 TaxID=485913 RepID=D6TYH6_KTERA|nr:hypothetical protein Krac_4199 [Ktedonobacter racemifer DSM 44963]